MARKAIYWLLGVSGFILACELVLQVLPVSSATLTGYHTDPQILTYPAGHQWRVATGWDLRNARGLRANNAGFVADHDFLRDAQAVALVGDSFVEASMLREPERPGAQLEAALGGRPVYALGGPGSALLDYAERIRHAHTQFGVRDFVVLMERGDVRQSLCGSGNIHGPCLDRANFAPRTETQPPPGLAKRVLRHSALAQYLLGQLKLSPQRLWRQALAQSQPPAESAARAGAVKAVTAEERARALSEVDAVARTFFDRAKPHVQGRLVIVLDGERDGVPLPVDADDGARAHFIALARQAGATVIDAEPLYRAHYAASALKLEVGPYDAHLNALGLSLLMRAAAGALRAP
jgi:hypothetical protein